MASFISEVADSLTKFSHTCYIELKSRSATSNCPFCIYRSKFNDIYVKSYRVQVGPCSSTQIGKLSNVNHRDIFAQRSNFYICSDIAAIFGGLWLLQGVTGHEKNQNQTNLIWRSCSPEGPKEIHNID